MQGAPRAAISIANGGVDLKIAHPILFATQVPVMGDNSRVGAFANHKTGAGEVPRGGDLWIRYPNGKLRNLTWEAGFGSERSDGYQDHRGIAVREPEVHWSGAKAIFSMVVGSPTASGHPQGAVECRDGFRWQLYEITGLGINDTVQITRVPHQPAEYNNLSPVYAADGRILFTTDKPVSGAAHLYPNLDEYESAETVSGIWSLNPATGALNILNHSPSGLFSPTIDSFGRVVFNRWDHLQRDQQNDVGDKGAKTFASEASNSALLASNEETFPERRTEADIYPTPYGPAHGHRFNLFTPWMMNQDGTDEETLNHIGRHELNYGFLAKTFQDGAMHDHDDGHRANRRQVFGADGGLFNLREDPTTPGTFYGIIAREFSQFNTNQIIKINAAPTVNANQMAVTDVTQRHEPLNEKDPGDVSPLGRFRNPLPLQSGGLVATYLPAVNGQRETIYNSSWRLQLLAKNAGIYAGGAQALNLTPGAGIVKSVKNFNPGNFGVPFVHNGPLWEMEAVEVVARTPVNKTEHAVEGPEQMMFDQAGVNVGAFKDWLKSNNLALIVTRDATSRDKGDRQQPFNLKVPGGKETLSVTHPPNGTTSKTYPISHLQIFQGDQVRAYSNFVQGRRTLARPVHDAKATQLNNLVNGAGPTGGVKIGADGSIAAVVPARRAMTWQTVDPQGIPIVRERVWVTFQPGEVRVCATCHGINERNQANAVGTPQTPPQALKDLLLAWKTLPQNPQSIQMPPRLKQAQKK